MKEPDFRELVGDEGTPEELAQLKRAHDLLVAAGPPPELSPRLAEAPSAVGRTSRLRRRRWGAVLALAAAVAAAAFFGGYAVGDRGNGFSAAHTIPMHGIGQLADAQASIGVAEQDNGGNYALEMKVRGLPRLPSGSWYELFLSKNGHPTLSCGTFSVAGKAVTVRLSVAYDLGTLREQKQFDGWIVVKHVPAQRNAPVVMTT